jgi:sulfur relay (sulfurtransferase) DsrF/TusC family protein
MSYLYDKAEFSANLYSHINSYITSDDNEVDGMKLMQILSGMLVETLLLFDEPTDGLSATYRLLVKELGTEPAQGVVGVRALPPAYMMDFESEYGRAVARRMFEEWLDCSYEFHELLIFFIQHSIIRMEDEQQSRAELLRLFIECSNRVMAYEISAQELCDIVIENKIGVTGWSLAESVSGLSAMAGNYLALSQQAGEGRSVPTMPERLDQLSYVMTQEAIRLGIPAGTDWRFGLAANDCPTSAPHDLIEQLEPDCNEFFDVIQLYSNVDRAVACAKAAGRILAVAAGGEEPEIEPVIAKPLAMAAITETYKTICRGNAAFPAFMN